jgi:branched-chain amino acid transport system ATP-binding protein
MITSPAAIHTSAYGLRRFKGQQGRMLEVRSVSKSFSGVMAVDGVSASVKRGEIVGLIGPNGAGKTTLFNLIAGSLRPSAGHILLNGQPIEKTPPHSRIRLGLGRTFQIPRPFGAMTVLENVVFAAQRQTGERILPNWFSPHRVAADERRNVEKAKSLLELVTLGNLEREPARVLSGGQRKLLELARILMADPEIILLDEPAAGVNPSLLEIIVAKIAEINRRGVTCLIIEHNMELVSRLCARVMVMAGGRIMCEGAPEVVSRDPRVIEAFLGGVAA